MNKLYKRTALLLALLLAFIPMMSNISFAALSTYDLSYALQTSYEFGGEFHRIATPPNEPNRIYMRGKVKDPNIKILCLRLSRVSNLPSNGNLVNVVTQFVKPNSNGEYSIRVDTTVGNTSLPVVYRGSIVDASNPNGSAEVKPGNPYSPMQPLIAGKYRYRITASTEDEDVTRGSEWWNGILGGSKGYVWNKALLRSKNDGNGLRCIKYPNIIDRNLYIRYIYTKHSYNIDSYQGSHVRYKDKRMRSPYIHYLFKDPVSGAYNEIDEQKEAFIKSISDEVTEGATSNYSKLLKIYEYTSKNFYYDYYAWHAEHDQYVNPYENLHKLVYKTDSANSKNGKVATVCDGYAGIVVALARAQGIPARIVYGKHLSRSKQLWHNYSDSQIKYEDNHVWAEAYLNGRWILIDANLGALSKWDRDYASDTGDWYKSDFISYAGFDPSITSISNSYSTKWIRGGDTHNYRIAYKNEYNKLKNFLTDNNNGQKINSDFSPNDLSTWGSGSKPLKTDGFGKVKSVRWNDKGLSGDKFNVSYFRSIRDIMIWSNDLTKINVNHCKNLVGLYATYNDVQSFYAPDTPKIRRITMRGNPMRYANFRSKLGTTKIERTGKKGGTFSFDYNKNNSKSLTIYINTVFPGYKYEGMYYSNGSLITKSTVKTFEPTGTYIQVRFSKLP